ncbi:flagellar basal body P-ring biosynthesis protein FlgA [Hylemonella gracilis str. Niagara R]|uniref:Flagellar basal body P-ring biosynthesis protein FlgA n=1 Tax=Hylemonella gracilis str. Niagara R TaxID=1458275 RepID=A0A016XEK6_9BURK|nr:flagellar basal body P-ring formation chaperone FlgA [Hylemonella gracilis]EYC49992.1 flagellar basal body P-ring biosynthesis protein FlgA [Hylemonella gracilis str. Niagara R]
MNTFRQAFQALRHWAARALDVTAKAGGLTQVLMRRGPTAVAWLSWLSLGLAMLVMGWSVPARAYQPGGPTQTYRVNSEADLPYVAQHWLERNLPLLSARESERGTRVRMQAQLGRLDGRLRLAPCAEVEVYTPSRLWGSSHLGMRCIQGATRWSVTLPVQVQVMGPAWVLRTPVSAGQAVRDQDLERREVDWAEDGSPVLLATDALDGQVAARGLRAGQALRQNMLRAAKVFTSGAQVRVLVQGSGFQVSTQGRAMSVGVVGQVTQVRMDNGRVMNATVVDARTVRVEI